MAAASLSTSRGDDAGMGDVLSQYVSGVDMSDDSALVRAAMAGDMTAHTGKT